MDNATFLSDNDITTLYRNATPTTTVVGLWDAAQPSPNRELLDRVFVSCLICLITVANVLMGCELDLNVVLTTLKRPVAPAIGFFTQFIIMPLLAYTIALFVLAGDDRQTRLLALGLFVTGCSPGGGASNYWTVLLDGNANLSVTMTFISTIGALVMMPLWMNLLGSRIILSIHRSSSSTSLPASFAPTAVFIPYAKIVASLLMLAVPLLLGVAIVQFKPQLASKARKLMRPFIIFVLVFIIVFGVSINLWLFTQITWSMLLAGLLLPWCGFMFGCFASIILAQQPPDVTAIAIETGVQNTGIAIMLLKLSFPGSDSDLASLLPISVACFTPGPLLLGYAIHSTLKKIRMRRHRRPSQTIMRLEDPTAADCGHELIQISRKCDIQQQFLPPHSSR